MGVSVWDVKEGGGGAPKKYGVNRKIARVFIHRHFQTAWFTTHAPNSPMDSAPLREKES